MLLVAFPSRAWLFIFLTHEPNGRSSKFGETGLGSFVQPGFFQVPPVLCSLASKVIPSDIQINARIGYFHLLLHASIIWTLPITSSNCKIAPNVHKKQLRSIPLLTAKTRDSLEPIHISLAFLLPRMYTWSMNAPFHYFPVYTRFSLLYTVSTYLHTFIRRIYHIYTKYAQVYTVSTNFQTFTHILRVFTLYL